MKPNTIKLIAYAQSARTALQYQAKGKDNLSVPKIWMETLADLADEAEKEQKEIDTP